jgi:hypothetical protein
MAIAETPQFLPMKTAGTEHLIERTYREGGAFQWVRETLINSLEASSTRVEFGIEWQAVENHGVHRRVIADNGCGMNATQLVEFFNTFGGGGKPIGGIHENFGVGAKTALLPWNRCGVVVISWVEGDPSMIWVKQDPLTGEYGLKLEEVYDEDGEMTLDEVYEPYEDDEHGCDWAAVKPEWIGDHGTVLVLLGNDPTDDTILGDPNRDESDIKGISAYLNRRTWETEDGVEITVDELRTQDRGQWPTSERMAHGPQPKNGRDRRTNLRSIQGARYYIEYPPGYKGGKLEASGTVDLADGTAVDWFLWDGQRPAVQSYAAIGGYIATLYRDELYDVTTHHSTYRSFGISEGSVRSRLWLIVRPPLADDDGKEGIYPRTDRNSLLLRGGPNAGGSLPVNDWANEFADLMPEEILEAIKAARAGESGTITDESWRIRLAERFGSRWRIPKLRRRKGGTLTVDATQEGTDPKKRKRRKKRNGASARGNGGRGGAINTGNGPGGDQGSEVLVAGGIPSYRKVRADAVAPGMLAAWHPNDPVHQEGAVLINVDHPVIAAEIEYWQSQYPDIYADDIADDVTDIYGEIAVAKVAHSEHLKGTLPSKVVDDELRSEAALTMSLLGLVGEEAVIAPRIGGKYRKKRSAA